MKISKNLADFKWQPTSQPSVGFELKMDNMTNHEYEFIRQLIKFFDFENIIEIGVARGGGSVNILTSMNDKSKLTSIDILKEVGGLVNEIYPNLPQDKWRLITEKDPFEVMDKLNERFDFVVIDSGHWHPVETMNFIAVLPYLEDGAIVVLHDISNYVNAIHDMESQYASRLLFSTVCAEKMIPDIPDRQGIENIGAFQITPDTRKYVNNLFQLLSFPWSSIYLPNNMAEYIHSHYGDYAEQSLNKALFFNKTILKRMIDYACKLGKLIFYGAGKNIYNVFNILDNDFPYELWDIAAEKIGEIHGHKVNVPDFETTIETNCIIVVTIGDYGIFRKVKSQFEPLGYKVVHGIHKISEHF